MALVDTVNDDTLEAGIGDQNIDALTASDLVDDDLQAGFNETVPFASPKP